MASARPITLTTATAALGPATAGRQRSTPAALAGLPSMAKALHLPFDLLRSHHALAVRTGLVARSMLESREFERRMHALEQLTLGPFARRV